MKGLARPEYAKFDDGIIHEVITANCYELPDTISGLVVDVGAHIGAFSFACLNRGARQILAYEADPINFQGLCLNIARFCNNKSPYKPQIVAHFGAVWRSDVATQTLPMGRFNSKDPDANTGGGSVAQVCNADYYVPAISLDSIIHAPVRLLKLDCEGAEYAILLTSKKLGLVQSIRLEYHDMHLTPEAKVGGIEDLVASLKAQGFTVRLKPVWKTAGYLFADRL